MINKNKLFSKKLSTFPELVQGILVGRLMFRNNDPKGVVANRKKAFLSLGIDLKNVVIQRQEHGNKVRVVQDVDRGAGVFGSKTYLRGTDGMITSKPNIFLVVHTADCVPISFYDPKKKIIALAHAGWRGTAERVGQKTVLEMKRVFGCNPRNIIAYIGPSIGPCCYNVGVELDSTLGQRQALPLQIRTRKKISQFKKAFPDCVYKSDRSSQLAVLTDQGLNSKTVYLDLWKANKKQLLGAGILEKNIEESKICTCCSKLNLPSHYREREKRNRSILSVIGMK